MNFFNFNRHRCQFAVACNDTFDAKIIVAEIFVDRTFERKIAPVSHYSFAVFYNVQSLINPFPNKSALQTRTTLDNVPIFFIIPQTVVDTILNKNSAFNCVIADNLRNFIAYIKQTTVRGKRQRIQRITRKALIDYPAVSERGNVTRNT